MSTEKKPTLIFLHGAHHTGAGWDQVISHLAPRGFKCVAPDLCFCGGIGRAPATWTPVVEQIQKLILAETSAGTDVVLVNHSLGGFAGCSSVEGFTDRNPSRLKDVGRDGRVKGIVQVAGITIRDADHQREVFKDIPSNPDENGWQPPPVHIARDIFYHDLEPEDADYWISQLLPGSAWLSRTAEGSYPGYGDVPVWFLFCDQDRMLPPSTQEDFVRVIKEVNDNLTVRHFDSAHSPFLNMPEQTADLVHEVAKEFMAKGATSS
ncbi:hypothetical protein ACJ41O_008853 [Fusarium nematophilum]